jgi:FtsH-binding integral membrane protein
MGKSSIYNKLFDSKNLYKGGSKVSFINLMHEKSDFLVLVFANLLVQLGISYYIMNRTNNLNINFWLLLILQIVIIFVLALVPMPEYLKFIIFCGFSYIFGLILSKLKNKYSPDLINIAIQGALTIFGLMFAAGVALILGGINIGYKFGGILFFLLLLLLISSLVFVLGAGMSKAKKTFSFFGIILFSIYVLYDTNKILQRNYYGDFITASMDYYLDMLNLFTNLLGTSDN